MKLIAKEPTKEMVKAAKEKDKLCSLHSGGHYGTAPANSHWQAMYDAAPTIETEAMKKAKRLVKNASEVLDYPDGKTAGFFRGFLAEMVDSQRELLKEMEGK